MIVEKVTKKMLAEMKPKENTIFTVPSWNKARSAQSLANQQKRETAGTSEPREYSAVIGDLIKETGQYTVSITRLV